MWIALALSLAINAAALYALWRRRVAHSAADAVQPGEALVVEIDDPLELAARDSRLAGLLGRLAPRAIRRRVYQRAAAILAEELAARGVRARVRVLPAGD